MTMMTNTLLNRVQIILVNPSHPGNIGATARAMKAMGLTQLILVAPKRFPHNEATARAAGADDILANAKLCTNLSEGLADCHLTYALSARSRRLPWPNFNPRQCVQHIAEHSNATIGLVFGRESNGLTNQELALCHYHVEIDANPEFPSLNLAAAVQVMTYELRQQALRNDAVIQHQAELRTLATTEQMHGFFNHLEQACIDLKVLNPKHPHMLMRRLQRLFSRAHLDTVEINILRGFLTAVNQHLQHSSLSTKQESP